MKRDLAILDYSIYGNRPDPLSDNLLAQAARAAGWRPLISPLEPPGPPAVTPECVWLRYDLRSRSELSWVVSVADRLQQRGHRVFPSAAAILLAEDKWETFHAFRQRGIPTPETLLGLELARCALPVILKPRVGWGGKGCLRLHAAADRAAATTRVAVTTRVAEDDICQPYLAHQRTWIVAVAGGQEIVTLQEPRNDPAHEGETQVRPAPPGAVSLALAALDAVGLVAGTVDLIESPAGLLVLEVNSAPRIPYPDLPDLDLATPMVRSVLAWMERPCAS